jgi:hypothetical protein
MTTPNAPALTDAPDLISVGAQSLVERAKSLGLTWTIRLAEVMTINPLTIMYDGDTQPVSADSMIGQVVAGMRVYGLMVPPSANFIAGAALPLFGASLIRPYGLHGNGIADSTASATFVNLAAPSSFRFTKLYSATRIRVQMSLGFFSNNANTGIDIGVTIAGTTTQVGRWGATISTGVHLEVTGVQYISGVQAGTYTVQGTWRRAAGVGTGTLSRDLNDWLSIEAWEMT